MQQLQRHARQARPFSSAPYAAAPRVCRRPLALRAQQAASSAATESVDQVPPGCSRYTVSLKKPLGIVLEQNPKTLIITVAEIKPESSASRTEIRVGDQLIATSGVTYGRIDDYGGAEVRGGQQIVRMRVMGETMKTVSAAIGSHPGHIPVTLEFQRCDQ